MRARRRSPHPCCTSQSSCSEVGSLATSYIISVCFDDLQYAGSNEKSRRVGVGINKAIRNAQLRTFNQQMTFEAGREILDMGVLSRGYMLMRCDRRRTLRGLPLQKITRRIWYLGSMSFCTTEQFRTLVAIKVRW